jgi:hypothetical protein
MLKSALLSGLAILIAWTVLDLLFHRYFLAPLYQVNAMLWCPFDQMDFALVYVVTFALIALFEGHILTSRKAEVASCGRCIRAFTGLALGISFVFCTYIHLEIPLTIAWSWFIGGWLKSVAAGAVVGRIITD